MSDAENSYRKSLKERDEIIHTYHDYWRKSLGPYLIGRPTDSTNQSHAQWLSDCTMGLTAEMDTARAIIAAVVKWRADAVVARTLGVPEPSVMPYLPDGIAALKAEATK